jgi:hypothetical protein
MRPCETLTIGPTCDVISRRLTFPHVLIVCVINLLLLNHLVLCILCLPDGQGNSVAIDFIGPLPLDEHYNCILSMTNRLGSDIWIIPTRIDITAEDLALLFFNHWYCENGLPKDIVLDRDKLFLSKFWTALHKLTGVKLKLSSSYHPETDGSSERSNKIINQCIRYHVHRNQKGWVHALPRIRFNMMNSVNASTGFSNFQIHLGRSPCLIPPLVPDSLTPITTQPDETQHARKLIVNLQTDVNEAKDNLMQMKIFQSFYANQHKSPELPFKIGDEVMLSTLHHQRSSRRKGKNGLLSFFRALTVHVKLLTHIQHPQTIPLNFRTRLILILPTMPLN